MKAEMSMVLRVAEVLYNQERVLHQDLAAAMKRYGADKDIASGVILPPWSEAKTYWEKWTERAFGVLFAMQVPTERMANAPDVYKGGSSMSGHFDILEPKDYKNIWAQMIEEALKNG